LIVIDKSKVESKYKNNGIILDNLITEKITSKIMSIELQKSNIFNGPEVTIENICTEMAPLVDNNICVST